MQSNNPLLSQRSAVIYARVSTEDQNSERQINELTAFAERAGYTVVAVFNETGSGSKNDRKERQKVMALAQARHINAVLVSELTRWGRSTEDLLSTLQQLAAWNVSVIAEHGWQFDLTTPEGKLMTTVMAGIAEFERGLLQQRVRSGMAAAKNRGTHIGRPTGHDNADKHAKKVMQLVSAGRSVRWIADELHISPTTVQSIKKRNA